jgi:hypothetical protein
MEHIDIHYERLWMRDDESIPKFIPIRSRRLSKYESQAPYALIDAGPRPLAVREPTPLLALHNPRVDSHIEKVNKKLGASPLEF